MKLRQIQDADLVNKKVLLRVDFNVAVKDGVVMEKFKIAAAKESVAHILAQSGAKLALVSHLGRPDGQVNPEFSLAQLQQTAEEVLGVKLVFVADCVGAQVMMALENLKEGEVLLLENVRFHAGEEKNDAEFAKSLAENFDVFVNDAFSVCHRDQASVTGVAKILPSFAGLWLQEEVEAMEKVKTAPLAPAVAIIGGAKIETKLPLIGSFEKTYAHILVGGKIANEAMDDKMEFSEKVILPIDLAEGRFDIGPKTIEKFKEVIATAQTIVWNGPMGKFEEKPYDTGTKEILAAVVASSAFVLMGGGESVEILEENDAMEKIGFVSTGGGAMLEYLSGNSMPGIEALKAE
jgi:3-phosphoglycerate kinase